MPAGVRSSRGAATKTSEGQAASCRPRAAHRRERPQAARSRPSLSCRPLLRPIRACFQPRQLPSALKTSCLEAKLAVARPSCERKAQSKGQAWRMPSLAGCSVPAGKVCNQNVAICETQPSRAYRTSSRFDRGICRAIELYSQISVSPTRPLGRFELWRCICPGAAPFGAMPAPAAETAQDLTDLFFKRRRSFPARARHRRPRRAEAHEEAGEGILRPGRRI